jgi:ADP-ribose pyrophosphatase YjhB (NUDIX family)
MNKILEEIGIPKNQPLYLYQQPMFMVTVSVVLIEENGVIVIEQDSETILDPIDSGRHPDTIKRVRFPGGVVKAGQETIQFSAVRQVKEQTGIVLKKDALIPVDFRSSPERSKEGNIVDIGMVCIINENFCGYENSKWVEVDLEKQKLMNISNSHAEFEFYMDHDILLKRALDVVLMMKE